MRSLVLTALVILFCIVSNYVSASGMFPMDSMPDSGLNQSTIQGFTSQSGITTAEDGQNAFYTQGINIVNFMIGLATGKAFIGDILGNWGFNGPAVIAANAVIGLLISLDLLLLWRGVHW
jgi:predicted MFS family arabinose efflux permease